MTVPFTIMLLGGFLLGGGMYRLGVRNGVRHGVARVSNTSGVPVAFRTADPYPVRAQIAHVSGAIIDNPDQYARLRTHLAAEIGHAVEASGAMHVRLERGTAVAQAIVFRLDDSGMPTNAARTRPRPAAHPNQQNPVGSPQPHAQA